jgi:hypothetical protein
MTTLVRHSPGIAPAVREGLSSVRHATVKLAAAGSTSAADRLQQQTSLLTRAAKKLREGGLAEEAELAQLLERSMLSLWAGASGADEQLLALLAVVRTMTAGDHDADRSSRTGAI